MSSSLATNCLSRMFWRVTTWLMEQIIQLLHVLLTLPKVSKITFQSHLILAVTQYFFLSFGSTSTPTVTEVHYECHVQGPAKITEKQEGTMVPLKRPPNSSEFLTRT